MWDLPTPGLEPVSLALASGFLTTAPPGKSKIPTLKGNVNEGDRQGGQLKYAGAD